MLCAAALLGVTGAAMGELGRIHPAAISAGSAAAFAFLVVFGSIVAFTAYGWLLRSGASSVLVSTYAYVNPAVAVLLGWAFAGEAVGGRELAAGAVIVSLGRDARPGAPRAAGGRGADAGDARPVPPAQGGAGASVPAGGAAARRPAALRALRGGGLHRADSSPRRYGAA